MEGKSLKAMVTSIDGERVTVVFEDGQKLIVPRRVCAGMPEVGKEARLLVVLPGGEQAGQQDLARELLNEILGST